MTASTLQMSSLLFWLSGIEVFINEANSLKSWLGYSLINVCFIMTLTTFWLPGSTFHTHTTHKRRCT